jgi:hypothetical protein
VRRSDEGDLLGPQGAVRRRGLTRAALACLPRAGHPAVEVDVGVVDGFDDYPAGDPRVAEGVVVLVLEPQMLGQRIEAVGR